MDDHSPDTDAKMRQNETNSSAADDRQRMARQAIRSQVTAREYAERHLARVERTVEDLQAKLHAARRERATTLEAVRVARAARDEMERGRRAAETALLNERSARDSAQQDAREARAMVQDLRMKLVLAKETIESLQVQVAPVVEPSAAISPAGDAPEGQPVKRKRGRPPGKWDPAAPPKATRKVYVDQEPVEWWKVRR